jgi:hypothetical protein
MSKKEKTPKKSISKSDKMLSNIIIAVSSVLLLVGAVKLGIDIHTKAVKQARIEACLDTKLKLHEMGADALLIHSFACADL